MQLEKDSPEHFYQTRVPNHWNQSLKSQSEAAERGDHEAQRLFQEMVAVQATIGITIKQDPSQPSSHYYLNIESGSMSAEDAPKTPPFLTLEHDLASLQALQRESGDSILGFLGALAGQKGDMKLTRSRIENLGVIEGALLFQLTGEAPMNLKAQFGPGSESDEPRCTVRLSQSTYHELKTGSLAPQDVFLNGLVEIEGDMQMAMQVALAAVAPD
ncbi:MAG: hypothetical protein CL917_12615 [Deltaproteobacteria bacterium]|nr:hypothetical protein [Deltaproteobacteria bacterium]